MNSDELLRGKYKINYIKLCSRSCLLEEKKEAFVMRHDKISSVAFVGVVRFLKKHNIDSNIRILTFPMNSSHFSHVCWCIHNIFYEIRATQISL